MSKSLTDSGSSIVHRGRFLSRIIVNGMTALLLCTGAAYLYLRYSPLPSPGIYGASRVIASDGSLLTDLMVSHNRIKVPLKEVPVVMRDATLAVEDAHFYEHSAFDFKGIMRAIAVDALHGRFIEGASTITQQLARNLYLTQDRTWVRKMREAVLATQLEMTYSKDSIFDQYLNVIYYGEGAYGVGMAAKTYFNVPVEKLDLAQSAMLAGIPKGPSIYSPLIDQRRAKERQWQVLERMVAAGYITQAEALRAHAEPLVFNKGIESPTGSAYFTSYLELEAQKVMGIGMNDLDEDGLTVQTTLSPQMQRDADAAVARYMPAGSDLQVSLVALDANTGEIRAMIGGRDYSQSSLNRVLQPRQTGSSFKPIMYLTAINQGITASQMVKSEPTTFEYDHGTRTYDVHNYEDVYAHKPIDMREAIARSDNVYAVDTNLRVGPDKVVATARRLGITAPLMPYPSLALGVFPVSPLEMAAAYAALANGGQRVTPHAIASIKGPIGDTLYHNDTMSVQVERPSSTFIVTDLLRSVIENGDGTAHRVASYVHVPVAGKTGSTDWDSWMIGYTPHLVTAVWVGYDQNKPLTQSESRIAAQVWASFMANATSNAAQTEFEKPNTVVRLTIDPTSGQLWTPGCSFKEEDYFLPGTAPRQYCANHTSPGLLEANDKPPSVLRSILRWFGRS